MCHNLFNYVGGEYHVVFWIQKKKEKKEWGQLFLKGGGPAFFFVEICDCWQHHLATGPLVEQHPFMPTPENVDFSTGSLKGNIH